MSWSDAISIALSLAAIIVSFITSLLVVSPHTYIHSICMTESKYIFLHIINNGFSPGLLFPDYGITYWKKGKRYFVPVKVIIFKPSVQIPQEYMKVFWDRAFIRRIQPKDVVFAVLDKQDVYNKLKEISAQSVTRFRFYLSASSPLRKSHTKKLLSQAESVKSSIKLYENFPSQKRIQ